MGWIVGFAIFMAFLFYVLSGGNRSGSLLGGFAVSGTPARGIMLAVSSVGTRSRVGVVRFEIRSARIDVEPPDGPPYEMDATLYIPPTLVRDVLPGSTMELRIDGMNRVYVVGPDVGYTPGSVRTS